jgi:hypothetical protein
LSRRWPAVDVSKYIKSARILRGNHAETGGGEAGAIIVDYASPAIMHDVEVTSDGKGAGIWTVKRSFRTLQPKPRGE